jgi:hypothetical protein
LHGLLQFAPGGVHLIAGLSELWLILFHDGFDLNLLGLGQLQPF